MGFWEGHRIVFVPEITLKGNEMEGRTLYGKTMIYADELVSKSYLINKYKYYSFNSTGYACNQLPLVFLLPVPLAQLPLAAPQDLSLLRVSPEEEWGSYGASSLVQDLNQLTR